MQSIGALILVSSVLVALSFAGVMRLPLRQMPTQRNAAIDGKDRHSAFLYKFRDDTRFYTYIFVGSPPQGMKLTVSTGSSAFWFPSVHCKSRECFMHYEDKHYYDPEASRTVALTGKRFSIKYPEGYNVSGAILKDTVSVGDMTVKDQEFGEASVVKGAAVLKFEWDGILGLGQPVEGMTPIFSNMLSQGLLSQPIFSYYINKDIKQGELILGGSEPNAYNGELKYISLLEDRMWIVPLQSLSLGDATYCNGGCPLMIDTAQRLIAGPAAEIKKINKQLGATRFESSRLHLVPCDSIPLLPNITFRMGGHNFTLTPEEYMIKNIYTEDLCMSGFEEKGSGNMWTIGDYFLRSYYAEFDYGNKRVGFAPQNYNN